jgi:DivIVA domain-containing protein
VKLILLLLVLGVLGLVIAVAAGAITGGLGDPARNTPDPGLPGGPLTAADLNGVRFTPALRGYRMDQVDALLDRLRDQLAAAEAEQLPADPGPEQRTPEQYAPEQYAPEQYAPEQYAPEQYAPEQYAPEQYPPEQPVDREAGHPAGPVSG